MIEEDFEQLAGFVRQLADAMLVQARKIVELQGRIQKLEEERAADKFEHDQD